MTKEQADALLGWVTDIIGGIKGDYIESVENDLLEALTYAKWVREQERLESDREGLETEQSAALGRAVYEEAMAAADARGGQ